MRLNEYQNLMNNTKWEEIRTAMVNYHTPVQWRVKSIDNGYVSDWDKEWFYHFKLGGYETIEWLEIKTGCKEVKNDIVDILRKIHVPGEVFEDHIKVYGYRKQGFIDYI